MIYIDITLFHLPTATKGFEIDTQSMDCAVRRVQDWCNGYEYAGGMTRPEIDRIARTKSRGVEYIKIEDMK